MVHGTVVPGGGDHRQRYREDDGDDGAVDEQEQGLRDALADDGRHRLALDDRPAEVALDGTPEKIPVLNQNRLVEAELGVGGAKHLLGRPAAEHELDRVPRHELHGEERDQRDPDEHRDHGEEAREHVAENAHRARPWRLSRSSSDLPERRDPLKDGTNDAG